ncbi:hypothetical protein [Rubellimicrobium aerolatum]|uniref:Lipoprotein n=1 Tax=Rubellimicrobium aerolatum TaxID=490979 RepID=A0ABW0SBQ5_9RHOB|nr:hypothetical protein [Rubellimicrobium aerolatum]MBP1805924.1 hypothetical protein [Rubellimicrobium aerolatum]
MRLPILLALLTLGGPVAAGCLGSADLGAGVVARFASGDSALLRRGGDGAIVVEERRADGRPGMRLRAAHGVYVFEEVSLDAQGGPLPETLVGVVYPQAPLTLPPPAPGRGWSGMTTLRHATGPARSELTTVGFSQVPPLEIGDCAYRAVGVEVRYDWGKSGALRLRMAYLPELGAALLLSREPEGRPARGAVPVALERMGE